MSRERILVVDDEPDVLALCERVLRSEGYRVRAVGSGFEAVQLAGMEPFDCLLTDITMPGMDGLDVAEAARAVNPDLVCITMTGFSTMDTAIEALRLGIEEFLIKPFGTQDLLSAVARALEKERLRRETARLRALLPLFEANRTFMSTTEPRLLAEQVVSTVVKELSARQAALFLLASSSSSGPRGLTPVALHQVAEADVPQWAEYAAQLVAAGDPEDEASRVTIAEEDTLAKGSEAAALIVSKQGISGVLIVARGRGESAFGLADREFLSVLCGQAGIALENAQLFQDLRRAYDDLKQLDHMKSEFISVAAHELRTPLAILMGYASLLEGVVRDEAKSYAEIILRNSQRLRALMDEMLNLDSLERGSSVLTLAPMRIESVLSSVVSDLLPLAQDRRHRLTLASDSVDAELVADREKLTTVLTNLVANAIKFTPDNGDITLAAHALGDDLEIVVSDTGVGIEAEHLEHVFERFYQVEDSINREHDGLGLGLSIAKGMVELMGGRIWVESEVGRGSSFHFTIPRHPLHQAEQS